MGIMDVFKKKMQKEEVEVLGEEEIAKGKVSVRVENLTGIIDVDRIIRLVSEGNIVFLKMRELQKKDIGQFQNTLQKLKRACMKFDWDIAALEAGYLIMTPRFAKIER